MTFVRKFFPILVRKYTTRSKKSILKQDVQSMPVYEFPRSRPHKKRIYAWGFAETGALGMQTSLKKHGERYSGIVQHPTRTKFAENFDVLDVAAGYGFTAFVVDGSEGITVFGTGLNTDCQLGLQEKKSTIPVKDENNETKSKIVNKQLDLLIYPTAIHLPRRDYDTDKKMQVKCMAAGRAHLVIVTQNDIIFTLGNNAYGQCGRAIIEKELYGASGFIHRIEDFHRSKQAECRIKQVECGQDHTLFVTECGKVYSCGWGADGQTGRENYDSTGYIDLVNGDIKNENIIKVSSRGDCVLALNDKGEVFGWGNSEYGQLFCESSEGTTAQINRPKKMEFLKGLGKITDIAAGGSFCMVLNDCGDVFTWGYGILGFGPYVQQTSAPKQLLPPLLGRTDFNPSSRVVSISSGLYHMTAINSEGDLFTWGKNKFGCLGLGHQQDQYFPFKVAVNGKVLKVSCGVDHTMALCKPFI